MMRRIYLLILILIVLLWTGCDMVEYHPNQVIVDEEYTDLNNKNIKKIKAKSSDDTITIALFGDTQRFYEETNEFVGKINSMNNIDFVVLAGDITDFGLNTEYKWVNEIISGLKVPYLTVIGNHDLVANGEQVYRQMYGPLDYSFEHDQYKFVFLNTNSREYGFNGKVPDLEWLDKSISDTSDKNILIFSHIPPYSKDFDEQLESGYSSILASQKNILGSLHAHHHDYYGGEYYDDGVFYFVTTTVKEKSFALLTLVDGEMKIEKRKF